MLIEEIYENLMLEKTPLNIKEFNDYFEIEVRATGLNKDDISIQLSGNLLHIKSKDNKPNTESSYTRREFFPKDYIDRNVILDNSVDYSKNIEANLNNGILTIKVEKYKKVKNIKINIK